MQALSAARYDAGTLSDSTNAGTLARISKCGGVALACLIHSIGDQNRVAMSHRLSLALLPATPVSLGNIALQKSSAPIRPYYYDDLVYLVKQGSTQRSFDGAIQPARARHAVDHYACR